MVTTTEAYLNYISSQQYQDLSFNTKKAYDSAWNCLSTFRIKGKEFQHWNITSITPSVVEVIKENTLVDRGLAATKMMFALMNNVWRKAYRMELVQTNPWASPTLKSSDKRDAIWTPQQITRFVHICRHQLNSRDAALVFLLCYETSQRPIDILSLKKEDVSKDYQISLVQKKTGATVNLLTPRYLHPELEYHVNSLGPWLFPNPTGGHRTYDWYAKKVDAVKRTDKIFSGLQTRDLRRTALTEALDADATDWQTQSMSGHSDPQSTAPYRVRSNKAAHEAQKKRWQARGEIDMWNSNTKPEEPKI